MGKKRRDDEREPRQRCLECAWCEIDPEIAAGSYSCAKTGAVLGRRRLWGRTCGRFTSLV